MPRYKEYNEKRILDIAMNEFWQNGFQASSVQQLSDAMHINKNTLYQVFENKEELLARSMQHFKIHYCDPIIKRFRKSPANEENLIKFFEGYLEHMKTHRNGCFILSITTETGSSVLPALRILKDYTQEIEELFVNFAQQLTPEEALPIIEKKALHLNHLFLSVMLISSINTYDYCINYINQMLKIINLNYQTNA